MKKYPKVIAIDLDNTIIKLCKKEFPHYITKQKIKQPLIQNTLNLTGGGALPLFGGLDVGFVRLLLFYGVLIATPTIPDIICQTVGKVGRAGQMIGSEISGATRAGQGYTNRVHGAAGEVGKGISQLQEGFVPKKGWGYIPGRGWTYTKTQPSPWEVVRTKGQPLP